MDPTEALALSDALLSGSRLDEHAQFLREAASRFPGNADIQLRAAAALFELAPAEAEVCIRRAAAAAPSDPNQLTRCGLSAFDLGDFQTAKDYAMRANDLAPEGDFELASSLVHLIGKLAIEADRPELAEQSLRLAFDRDPEMVGHGRVLAAYLAEQGRPADALEVVERALRHLPGDPGLVALERELVAAVDRLGE